MIKYRWAQPLESLPKGSPITSQYKTLGVIVAIFCLDFEVGYKQWTSESFQVSVIDFRSSLLVDNTVQDATMVSDRFILMDNRVLNKIVPDVLKRAVFFWQVMYDLFKRTRGREIDWGLASLFRCFKKQKQIHTPMPVSDKDFIYFEAQRAAIDSSCTDMRRICIKFLSNSKASVALDCVLEYMWLIFCETLLSL